MNRRLLRSLIVCAAMIGMGHAVARADTPVVEDGFVSVFDGDSLTGWSGDKTIFRVQDGAIVAGTLDAKVARNEFLTLAKDYADFELRLSARIIGNDGNAGVQIRSRRIPDHHEMIGYQVDMGKSWGKMWWGKLYDESRRRKVLAAPDDEAALATLAKVDDWNDLRVRCEGKRIRIWLNGTLTVDYTEPQDDIELNGLIGVQIHGGPPSEAWYKNIRIQEL